MQPIHEVLAQAMGTELQGRRFYERALERTASPDGRALLQVLIGEENKHLDLLRGQYAALNDDGAWVTLAQAEALAAQVPDATIFPSAQVADMLIPEGAADDLVMRLALGFERRGAGLYREAAAKASDEAERAVWQFLAEEEDRHYALIQRTLDNLAAHGTWSAPADRSSSSE